MHRDPIRKALAPYLSELLFPREDAAGILIKPLRDATDDKSFLRWYEINDRIKRLGGSWVKPTKFTDGHWRIPKPPA